jgi:TonB family protein
VHTPAVHPTPKPTLDNKTLEHLRAMSPPPPPAPVTQPTPAAPNVPPPTTPTVAAPRPSQPIADAPTPQPTTRPNFSTPGTAQDAIQQAIQSAAKHPGGGGAGSSGSSSPLNTGVDILSDTQGVNFNPYISRILREIYQQWLPLIPEEARPPLSKQGETLIRFSILPDGTIGAMHLDGSTHDGALDRAAWGSITGVGQFPPLPKQFTGPNLELRIHYLVNKTE